MPRRRTKSSKPLLRRLRAPRRLGAPAALAALLAAAGAGAFLALGGGPAGERRDPLAATGAVATGPAEIGPAEIGPAARAPHALPAAERPVAPAVPRRPEAAAPPEAGPGGGEASLPEPAAAPPPAPPPRQEPVAAAPPIVQAALRPPTPPADLVPHGTPAWLRNAAAADWPKGRPAIAVVIDDMGPDRRRSARAAALPGPLTLAWLPYAQDLPRQTAAARAAGHELLVHLPMQPQGAENPGPGAMLVGLEPGELRRRVAAALGAFDGHVGLNNHMGSRFTEDRAGMAVVVDELRRRGLMFLDSRTTGRSVGMAAAADVGLPSVGRDVFIDHDMSPAAVRAALGKLEAVARRQGHAIGIGHPHDVTISALAEWLPGLRARGFAVVPVSAVARARRGE